MTASARVRLAVYALAAIVLTDCPQRNSTTGTATAAPSSTSDAETTPPPSPSGPATAASPSPTPAYTGPATLIRPSDSYIGQMIDATTFVSCTNVRFTVLPTDTIKPRGSCDIGYEAVIRQSAKAAVAQQSGLGNVLINGVSQSGDTAVATYVHGGDAGQVLLVRSGGAWISKSVTSGTLSASSASAAGVAPSTVVRLQKKLPFDVKATALPVPAPT